MPIRKAGSIKSKAYHGQKKVQGIFMSKIESPMCACILSEGGTNSFNPSNHMEMESDSRKLPKVHLVCSTDSPEFALLNQALTRTSLVGLDAEWKPVRTHQTSFPTVALLQIACRLNAGLGSDPHESGDSVVFLLDLLSIPLSSLWESLRDMLASPDILKLGFRFKQDLIYLSSTFCSQGCDPGFDKVSGLFGFPGNAGKL